jgi:hypothetical protein
VDRAPARRAAAGGPKLTTHRVRVHDVDRLAALEGKHARELGAVVAVELVALDITEMWRFRLAQAIRERIDGLWCALSRCSTGNRRAS